MKYADLPLHHRRAISKTLKRLLVFSNIVLAIVLITKFSSLNKAVIDSKNENRVVNLQQKVTNHNTATASSYTIIVDRDFLKKFKFQVDEIRDGVEKKCNPEEKFWSKKSCFHRVKPSILETYKDQPFGYQIHTIENTLYVSYWKAI